MTRRQHANKFRWRVRPLGFGAGCRERRVRLCGVCLMWMGSAAVLEGARAGEASAGEASGR